LEQLFYRFGEDMGKSRMDIGFVGQESVVGFCHQHLGDCPSKVRGSISHGKWSIEIDGLPINSMVDLSMAMLVITRG